MDAREAIEKLDLYGYCILEGLLSRDETEELEQAFYDQHRDPAYEDWKAVEQWDGTDHLYETLYGLLLREEGSWEVVGHPVVLEVVRHFVGDDVCVGYDFGGTKWNKPGSKSIGSVHVDDGRFFVPLLPEMPYMINSMWMITDFTEANGATRIAPMPPLPVPLMVSASPMFSGVPLNCRVAPLLTVVVPTPPSPSAESLPIVSVPDCTVVVPV